MRGGHCSFFLQRWTFLVIILIQISMFICNNRKLLLKQSVIVSYYVVFLYKTVPILASCLSALGFCNSPERNIKFDEFFSSLNWIFLPAVAGTISG